MTYKKRFKWKFNDERTVIALWHRRTENVGTERKCEPQDGEQLNVWDITLNKQNKEVKNTEIMLLYFRYNVDKAMSSGPFWIVLTVLLSNTVLI